MKVSKNNIVEIDFSDACAMYPIRKKDAHKNNAGHALLIAGSRRMPGAAAIASNSALRSGVGLLTACFPESAYPAITSHLVEGMMLPVHETEKGFISKEALPEILDFIKKVDVVAIGPGLGSGEDTEFILDSLLENLEVPLIIESDGLNALSKNVDLLTKAKGPVI